MTVSKRFTNMKSNREKLNKVVIFGTEDAQAQWPETKESQQGQDEQVVVVPVSDMAWWWVHVRLSLLPDPDDGFAKPEK